MSAVLAVYIIVFVAIGFICVLDGIISAFCLRDQFVKKEVGRQMRGSAGDRRPK